MRSRPFADLFLSDATVLPFAAWIQTLSTSCFGNFAHGEAMLKSFGWSVAFLTFSARAALAGIASMTGVELKPLPTELPPNSVVSNDIARLFIERTNEIIRPASPITLDFPTPGNYSRTYYNPTTASLSTFRGSVFLLHLDSDDSVRHDYEGSITFKTRILGGSAFNPGLFAYDGVLGRAPETTYQGTAEVPGARGLEMEVGSTTAVDQFDVSADRRTFHFKLTLTGGTDEIRIVTETTPGDTDANDVVNFDDLLALARNYGRGSGATWEQGDFDFNGAVNFDDLLALARNYSTSPATLTAASLATASSDGFVADWTLAASLVPEPTSLALVSVIATIAPRRRRSKN